MLLPARYRKRCRVLARTTINEPLRKYLEAAAALNINHHRNTPILAVDLEMTGVDARTDAVVAFGWAPIDQGRIQLGKATHEIVRTDHAVAQSATVHLLTDGDIARGTAAAQVIEHFLEAATGRLLLFHNAKLDVAFIKRMIVAQTEVQPPIIALDTQRMALQKARREDRPLSLQSARLRELREEFGLPAYVSHHAMIDAMATAELFLAMAARGNPSGNLLLKKVIHRY